VKDKQTMYKLDARVKLEQERKTDYLAEADVALRTLSSRRDAFSAERSNGSKRVSEEKLPNGAS
jgi:hypothetical protein